VGSIPASIHDDRARRLYLWWYASPGAAADQPGVQDWYIPFAPMDSQMNNFLYISIRRIGGKSHGPSSAKPLNGASLPLPVNFSNKNVWIVFHLKVHGCKLHTTMLGITFYTKFRCLRRGTCQKQRARRLKSAL
jgi:hypothetical protein